MSNIIQQELTAFQKQLLDKKTAIETVSTIMKNLNLTTEDILFHNRENLWISSYLQEIWNIYSKLDPNILFEIGECTMEGDVIAVLKSFFPLEDSCPQYNFQVKYAFAPDTLSFDKWFEIHEILTTPFGQITKDQWTEFQNDRKVFDNTDLDVYNINQVRYKSPHWVTELGEFEFPIYSSANIEDSSYFPINPDEYFTVDKQNLHTHVLKNLHSLHDQFMEMCFYHKKYEIK
jgi:hypothetical protein